MFVREWVSIFQRYLSIFFLKQTMKQWWIRITQSILLTECIRDLDWTLIQVTKCLFYVSLLTTFKASNIFWGGSVIILNRLEPETKHHGKVRHAQISDTHGIISLNRSDCMFWMTKRNKRWGNLMIWNPTKTSDIKECFINVQNVSSIWKSLTWWFGLRLMLIFSNDIVLTWSKRLINNHLAIYTKVSIPLCST